MAVRLASRGATCVLADVAGDLPATEAACCEANQDVAPVVVRFDVTDEATIADTFRELGRADVVPDLLFNNAGYQGDFANVTDYAVDDFRRVMDVNVTGAFLVLRSFANALMRTGRPGAVVNSASMAQQGAPNMAAYSASKAAVVALTRTAAKDLAPASIRVNSVSPAFIGPGAMWERQVERQANTPSRYYADEPAEVEAQMIDSVPMRRYGSLDEVAAVVTFLLSDDASYLTGIDVPVAGGAS